MPAATAPIIEIVPAAAATEFTFDKMLTVSFPPFVRLPESVLFRPLDQWN